jgi:hypothetical protein
MTKIVIKVKEMPLRKGHQARRSSAGQMGDRRTKRQRTRGDKHRQALKER